MRALELNAERGLQLLDDVRDQVRERSYEGDAALGYARISRAIRQTVMLHAKFEEEASKTDAQREAEAAAARTADEAEREAYQKRQVKRAVTRAMDIDFDAAEARGEKRDYAELHVELHERLDDYDDYSDFGRLPVSAVVENICKVMGLEFDPALWEDEPWAVAEMAEKPEGSPYTEWQSAPLETANDDEAGDDDADPDDPGADEDDPYGLAEDDDPARRRSRAPP